MRKHLGNSHKKIEPRKYSWKISGDAHGTLVKKTRKTIEERSKNGKKTNMWLFLPCKPVFKFLPLSTKFVTTIFQVGLVRPVEVILAIFSRWSRWIQTAQFSRWSRWGFVEASFHVYHHLLAHLKFGAWYLFGPGALFFFTWYLSQVGVGQVLSFFPLGISARSDSARCGYILAWYPGPVTLSGSWWWKTCT